MQRRKSFCIQSHVSQREDNELTLSSSFTLEDNRRLSSSQEGVKVLQAHSVTLKPISPKRNPCFPGARLLRSSLRSFCRNGRPTPLKGQCVWTDTPKEDPLMKDASCMLSIKGGSTRVKSFTESGTETESLDLFPDEGVLSLPLHDPNHQTIFSLSRVLETGRYGDSSPGTSLINTDRTESTNWRMKTQRSNQFNSSRGVGLANSTCSSWDAVNYSQRTNRWTLQFFNVDEVESIGTGQRHHPAELDSDLVPHRIPNRSYSSVDVSKCANPFDASSSGGGSPAAVPVRRPCTRCDSRFSGLNSNKRTDTLPVSLRSDYSQITSTTITPRRTPTSASKLPKSFRSDQFLFQDSKGKSKKLRVGEMSIETTLSERNLCIGKRSEGIGSSGLCERPTRAIRRMQPPESLTVFEDNVEMCSNKCSTETKDGPLSVTEDTHLDSNECSSALEDPRSLAMWFDWLEERADLTRKEILYRMKCQKAFIREANERLERHALMSEECMHLVKPTTKERIRALRKKCTRQSTQENNVHSSTDEEAAGELMDINLQEVDAPTRVKQQSLSLNLTL